MKKTIAFVNKLEYKSTQAKGKPMTGKAVYRPCKCYAYVLRSESFEVIMYHFGAETKRNNEETKMNYIDEIENLKFHQLMTLLSELQIKQIAITYHQPFNSIEYYCLHDKINTVLSQMKILSFGIR